MKVCLLFGEKQGENDKYSIEIYDLSLVARIKNARKVGHTIGPRWDLLMCVPNLFANVWEI
jgi:hypothetical protein